MAVFESFGADPEVNRFLAWRPHKSIADAQAALIARRQRLADGIEYSWMIELTTTRRVVGIISAWLEDDAAELGFVLARSYWNQGLATEAVLIVTEWAFASPEVSRVWATCDVENRASARVLEKAGFTNLGLFEKEILRPNIDPRPRPSLFFSAARCLTSRWSQRGPRGRTENGKHRLAARATERQRLDGNEVLQSRRGSTRHHGRFGLRRTTCL